MKINTIRFPEILELLAYILYLTGSSIAHVEDGSELSLWLMTFAVVISFAIRLLPQLGFGRLKLAQQGCRWGWWLAIILQITSWVTYTIAMVLRMSPNLPSFHTMITLTTLLWSIWLVIFIYSRHACKPLDGNDTLKEQKLGQPENLRKVEGNEKRF